MLYYHILAWCYQFYKSCISFLAQETVLLHRNNLCWAGNLPAFLAIWFILCLRGNFERLYSHTQSPTHIGLCLLLFWILKLSPGFLSLAQLGTEGVCLCLCFTCLVSVSLGLVVWQSNSPELRFMLKLESWDQVYSPFTFSIQNDVTFFSVYEKGLH